MRCRPPQRELSRAAVATSYLAAMQADTELSTDVALGVTIPARHARGRLARIGPVLDRVLANHDYPPVIETFARRGAGADGVARLAAQGSGRAS